MISILSVGHQQMQLDLTAMQQAFADIMSSQTLDYQVIKLGLDAIRNLTNFLENVSTEKKNLGHFSQLHYIKIYTKCLQENITQAIFLQTLGQVDLQAKNILNPAPQKTIQSIEFSLKSNMTGKMVLLDLNQHIVKPIAKTLQEMESAIKDAIQNLLNLADKSKLEIGCYEGSHLTALATGNELHIIPNSKEINGYQALLEDMNKQREFLARIQFAAQKYPGFGLTPLVNNSID